MILFMDRNHTNIYDILASKFEPEKPLKVYKAISVSERGVFYLANMNPEREAVVFAVDGVIIKEGCKCDKLLLSRDTADDNSWFSHFIELKGSDVNHAIEQLEATICNPLFRNKTISKNLPE